MANQSLTISFVTQSDSAELKVDMDDTQNEALNSGRTSSFIYGDTAYFRVFTNPVSGVAVSCYASDGVLTDHGLKTVSIQEYISFTQPPLAAGGVVADNVASLSKPVLSGFTASGLPSGSPSGSVSLNPNNPEEAMASIAAPGVYDVSYTAQYRSFSIQKATIPSGFPTDESYPIVIVIVGV